MVDFLSVQPVTGADLDGVETIQNIELGQRQPVDAAGPHGLAHQHGIEPADAPLASSIDPELLAAAANLLADLVMQFGRKRALADPGRIGLADAQHVTDGARAHAGSGRRLRRHGVGRGDVGIGSVIDIEPRRVVPIAVTALEDSRNASSSRCNGRISVTFSATRRFSGLTATPCAFSFATSSRNACGSNTTPLPITASLEGRSTPEGNSASL